MYDLNASEIEKRKKIDNLVKERNELLNNFQKRTKNKVVKTLFVYAPLVTFVSTIVYFGFTEELLNIIIPYLVSSGVIGYFNYILYSEDKTKVNVESRVLLSKIKQQKEELGWILEARAKVDAINNSNINDLSNKFNQTFINDNDYEVNLTFNNQDINDKPKTLSRIK